MGNRLGKDNRWWIILFAFLGGLLNRIRGGLWDVWNKKLWYPLFLGLLVLGYGLPWWSVLVLAALWYLGQQIYGWGNYFGAAIFGKKPDKNEDCKWINAICWSLADKPFKYGIVTLWLRGIVWNGCAGLGLMFLAGMNERILVFVGLLSVFFGLVPYVLGRAFGCGLGPNDDHSKDAWNLSEILWGVLQTTGWCWVLEGAGI